MDFENNAKYFGVSIRLFEPQEDCKTVGSWFMVKVKVSRIISRVLISVYIKAIVFISKTLSF